MPGCEAARMISVARMAELEPCLYSARRQIGA
jgi:hypothetical protein